MTDEGTPSDADLVRRLVAGDAEAWACFVDRHGPWIHGLVRRMLERRTGRGDAADVDEVVAEVFLSLLRDDRRLLRRYDPAWRFGTWIGVICRTAVGRRLRRARPERRLSGDPDDPATRAGPDPEVRSSIEAALLRLEPRDRHVLSLRYLEGLDTASLAVAFDVAPESVPSLLSRARRRLAEVAPDLAELLEGS